MIKIIDINNSKPYKIFTEFYNRALEKDEKHIEAINISSLNKPKNEVDSRYVNLKYIKNDEWIFFSNYNSPKSIQFLSHDQICATFFWKSIYAQVRIMARIEKTSSDFSDHHFMQRDDKKNALAISSNQSDITNSYEEVEKNYSEILKKKNLLLKRPHYWGGYSFTPYYFEFWEGHNSRLNRREAFKLIGDNWDEFYLEP